MKNNIHKEIADIAPNLASIPKVNPFVAPEGYFYSLENHVLDAIDKKPILSNSTPDDYFNNLSERVLERVKSKEHTKVIPFYRKKWLSIAAAFIVLLGAGYLLNTQLNTTVENTEFVLDIDPEEALDYLVENDNFYLSDLLTLDAYEDEVTLDISDYTDLEDMDIDVLLNELDHEDLEDLL